MIKKYVFKHKPLVILTVLGICVPFSRLLGQHTDYHTGVGVVVPPVTKIVTWNFKNPLKKDSCEIIYSCRIRINMFVETLFIPDTLKTSCSYDFSFENHHLHYFIHSNIIRIGSGTQKMDPNN